MSRSRFIATALFLLMLFNYGILNADENSGSQQSKGKLEQILRTSEKLFVEFDEGYLKFTNKRGKVYADIDWGTKYVTARGMGTSPSGKIALARTSAIMDAERNLVRIKESHIKSETRKAVNEYTKEDINDCIIRVIEGVLKGAQVVPESEKWDEKKKLYTLMMKAPIGKFKTIVIKGKSEKEVKAGVTLGSTNISRYTGLLVDTRGLKLASKLDKIDIYNEDLERVSGPFTRKIIFTPLTLPEINDDKIGNNPLRITAKAAIGNNKVNIIVSNSDADMIRYNLENTDIFKKGKVIVVVD